jgi:hypothetical protein
MPFYQPDLVHAIAQLMSSAPAERRGTASAVSGTFALPRLRDGLGDRCRDHRDGGSDTADPGTILRAAEPAFLIAAAFAAIGAAFSALPD